jgi:hypothetical protein
MESIIFYPVLLIEEDDQMICFHFSFDKVEEHQDNRPDVSPVILVGKNICPRSPR